MISVVIPAFNEEEAIVESVNTAERILSQAGFKDFEILVVDDASTDKTADLASTTSAKVIRKPQNIGYGHSLKRGIREARNDIIVITDADGTYPFETVVPMIERHQSGIDMVIGQRTGKHYHESLLKHPMRILLKWLVEFTAGREIPDPNSGLRVFSKKTIIPFFGQLSDTFSFTTSATLAYMLNRHSVEYISIPYHSRIGKTKVRLFRDSLRTLQHITQAIVYYNPLKIFVILCLIALLLSLLAAWLHFLGMIVSLDVAFNALISSILIFGLGLICERIRQTSMRNDD